MGSVEGAVPFDDLDLITESWLSSFIGFVETSAVALDQIWLKVWFPNYPLTASTLV